jgi:hypothetical protein
LLEDITTTSLIVSGIRHVLVIKSPISHEHY